MRDLRQKWHKIRAKVPKTDTGGARKHSSEGDGLSFSSTESDPTERLCRNEPDHGLHANLVETLPDFMLAADIRRLMSDPNTHELDHLISQAARHAASLRQLNSRLSELNSPAGVRENLGHGHALWKHRLDILNMISDARSTLARITEPERVAVQAARFSLRPSAREGSTPSTRPL